MSLAMEGLESAYGKNKANRVIINSYIDKYRNKICLKLIMTKSQKE